MFRIHSRHFARFFDNDPLEIRRTQPHPSAVVSGESPQTDCHKGAGRELIRGVLFESDVSSVAVRVGYGSGVDADHRTPCEFIGGLSALQKPARIFQLQQQHSLDLPAAHAFRWTSNARVNSRRFLFEDPNVNLRPSRCCLEESLFLVQLPCHVAIITECLLSLLWLRPNCRGKRRDIQLLDHKLRHLFFGVRHIVTCCSRRHAGQCDHSTKQFHDFSPLFFIHLCPRYADTGKQLDYSSRPDLNRSPLPGVYPQFAFHFRTDSACLAVYAIENPPRCPVNPTSNAATL